MATKQDAELIFYKAASQGLESINRDCWTPHLQYDAPGHSFPPSQEEEDIII